MKDKENNVNFLIKIASYIVIILICLVVFLGLNFLSKVVSSVLFSQTRLEKKVSIKNPLQIQSQTQSQEFLPQNLKWIEITSFAPWEPRDSGEAFVFKDKIWLMGGLNGNGKVNFKDNTVEYGKVLYFNDIWNTEDGLNWKRVTSLASWFPRRSMSVEYFKGKLWMLGGWSPVTKYSNDIWVSEDGIRWIKIVEHANFPPAEGQVLKVFKNKLWKIGGVNYDEKEAKNDVWYSEDGINWKKVENVPWAPRWDHAVAEFKGKLFLAGGMDTKGNVFNDVWYTEDGINWELATEKAPWAPRQGHALLTYNDTLWLIGRLNDKENGGENDVWFSRDGINWEKTKENPPWTGREDFFCLVFKNKIWVFGGMDANWEWKNDVWVSDFKY